MGNFDGWLLKFGSVQLPNSFLLIDGYEDTPNQRLELDAFRDASALLHRETSQNTKTKLSMKLKGMTLEERMAFDNVIGLASLPAIDKLQRRVNVTYWNDETLSYQTGVFYMPDITWVIHNIDEESKTYDYNPVSLTLIEY